jgi:mycothiol synthase
VITSRPLHHSDLDAAVALLHADDRRWFGEPVLTLEDVRAEWNRPGFDLAAASEGWFDDAGPRGEALVAFATLSNRGDLAVAVDEAWQPAGLEEALLQRWEDEARRRGLPRLQRDLAAEDVEGVARLTARSWVLDETGWLLRLEPATPLAARELPGGYAVRPVLEADLPDVHRVVMDAFARYGPTRPYDDWHSGMVDRPDVTLGHWRLATYAGAAVGVCLVQDTLGAGGREAWVPQLAVNEEHRRRGLARELLVRVALAARERGVPRLGLYTSEATGALGLYEGLGMRVLHTLSTCTLTL